MNNNYFIMRHGQDEDNAAGILNGHRDTSLTELGRHQAQITSQKLKGVNIEIIYTSPLKRAYETARIVASELKVDEIIFDNDLIERDFGILTGKQIVDIQKYTDKILKIGTTTYFLEAEGAENFPTLLEKAKKFFSEINERHSGKNILLVCHGDIGRMIRAAYHNIDWKTSLKTHFDNTEVLELSRDKML